MTLSADELREILAATEDATFRYDPAAVRALVELASRTVEAEAERDAMRQDSNAFKRAMHRYQTRAEAAERTVDELRAALRAANRYAPTRAIEAIRAKLKPGVEIVVAECTPEGFTRKQVFNAVSYLTRTGELQRVGYGKYRTGAAYHPERDI